MSWWNSSWKYRKKLTFDNSGQSENLTNFPVLVALTSSNFDFNKAKDNGEDIRFVDSDDATLLKHEIEKWDKTNQKAWVWVKVPQIDGLSSTDYIYIYYGNSSALDGQDAANVWDTNFKAVWHLNKTSGNVLDSTANNNDGTNNGATRGQTGKVDGAFSFDGIDDYINVPNAPSLQITAAITVEAWIKFDVVPLPSDIALCKETCYRLISSEADNQHAMFRVSMDGIGWNDISGNTVLSAGTLYHIVGTYDGSYLKIYLDGISDATPVSQTGNIHSNTNDVIIADWSAGGGYQLDGIMDEVRISDIARSADWIKAQYLSMTLAFITFGSEEGNIISSDSGSGLETLGSRELDTAETGSGIGASSLLAALIGTEETGLGSEFATKIFYAFDSGSGIDAVISRLLAATETGSGVEVALLITVLISGDGGLGSDLSTLLSAILAIDEGNGFDALRALIETTGSDMRLLASRGQVRIPSKGVNL